MNLEKLSIKELIFQGYSVQYRKVSMCDLRRYLPHRSHHARVYQVHSPYFTEIYKDIDQAVNKFLELKKKAKYSKRVKNANKQ